MVKIAEAHVEEAKAFMYHYYNVDLSHIFVHIAIVPETEDVEGFTLAHGVDHSTVVVPCHFSSPVELIVHELGHSMHNMIRRRNAPTDIRFWTGGTTEAEMCAYHAQFNYLLKHGTQDMFYQALGALMVKISWSLCLKLTNEKINFSKFKNHPLVQAYKSLPPYEALLQMFLQLQESNCAYQSRRFFARKECNYGLGNALALALIDESSAFLDFMSKDSYAVPLAVKLKIAFPHRDDLQNLDHINEIIKSISDRISN